MKPGPRQERLNEFNDGNFAGGAEQEAALAREGLDVEVLEPAECGGKLFLEGVPKSGGVLHSRSGLRFLGGMYIVLILYE